MPLLLLIMQAKQGAHVVDVDRAADLDGRMHRELSDTDIGGKDLDFGIGDVA